MTKDEQQALNDKIYWESYHTFTGTTLTMCLLRSREGFPFLGSSVAPSLANFDEVNGMKMAKKDAGDKLWAHEAYAAREKLKSELAKLIREKHEVDAACEKLSSELAKLVCRRDEAEEKMKGYVGTTRLKARPMTRGDYNKLCGAIPDNDGHYGDEGYLVEDQDGGEPNHTAYEGYISWLPKERFERTYKEDKMVLRGEGWAGYERRN